MSCNCIGGKDQSRDDDTSGIKVNKATFAHGHSVVVQQPSSEDTRSVMTSGIAVIAVMRKCSCFSM